MPDEVRHKWECPFIVGTFEYDVWWATALRAGPDAATRICTPSMLSALRLGARQ